ncbi:hypothetical protein CKAN_01386700 [Cinnamomum micranthum f. kanehirae]|uniref:Uncharacterized protein n=1 Tax=Cinnamomum micranthum f. kanehirae TaxID=337451 RepID=A0A3S3P7V7_9MAGN|nr:hypothetical protein CKAN_01386700 [Cinnamomum micranthum f. kanehirae]
MPAYLRVHGRLNRQRPLPHSQPPNQSWAIATLARRSSFRSSSTMSSLDVQSVRTDMTLHVIIMGTSSSLEARQGSRSICPSFSRSAVEAEVVVSDRSNKVPVGSGRVSFASAWKQATLLSMVDQSLIIYRRITPCRSTMQSSNGTSLPCGPDRNQIRQGDYMMPVQYVCSDERCYRSWLPSTLIFSHFRQWIGSKNNIDRVISA